MRKPQIERNGILIFLFVILLLGFTITSVLSYLVSKENAKNSAITQTLPLISDNIYSMIETDFMDPINTSSLMANDTFLMNWVMAGEDDAEQISGYLSRIKERYGYTSAFFVSDITGKYYTPNGVLKTISEQDDHDEWYYLFKSTNKPYDLDIDTDEAANGTLTIFINHRLETSGGSFLGATGVGLQMADIGDRLRAYQKQFEHEIYLIDSQGVIQVHPDEKLIENTTITEMEGIEVISGEILSVHDEIRIFEYEDAEGVKDISVRYIPEFDWFLIVEKDQDASLLSARAALTRNILIGLGVTVLVSGLIFLIIRNYNQQLEQLATHDQLTGLFNRRTFDMILQKSSSAAKRTHTPLSILFIDVDDFKSVNDKYGHAVGDDVLMKIAKTMTAVIREEDIVVRWGGEEFIILLPDANQQAAFITAQRVKNAIEKITIDHLDIHGFCSVSIGISTYSGKSDTIPDLIQQADSALYQAKVAGKNTIVSFTH